MCIYNDSHIDQTPLLTKQPYTAIWNQIDRKNCKEDKKSQRQYVQISDIHKCFRVFMQNADITRTSRDTLTKYITSALLKNVVYQTEKKPACMYIQKRMQESYHV